MAAAGAGAACSSFGENTTPVSPTPEAGEAGEAGAQKPFTCDDVPTRDFCDDFERESLIGNKAWVARGVPLPSIVSDASASPTRSMRVEIPAAGQCSLFLPIEPTKRHLEISLAIRIDELPANLVELVNFSFADSKFVYLSGSAKKGLQISEQILGGDTKTVDVGTPPSDKFVRYTFIVDLETRTATVTTDTLKLGGALNLLFAEDQPNGIAIGNAYSLPSDAGKTTHAWLDDVVLVVR